MENLPNCPKCASDLTYEAQDLFVCPECGHEWKEEASKEEASETLVVKDAHGNVLKDGDSVTVIKDIKVKGSSTPIKMGLKITDIRLVPPVNGHNIDCKIKGFGPMMLKSELVKKSTD